MRSCAHCGGEVGEDGFARKMYDGGEVPSEENEMPGPKEEEETQENEDSHDTEQQESTESMRELAFVDALGARSYASSDGKEKAPPAPESQDREAEVDSMRRKKLERYGFGRGR